MPVERGRASKVPMQPRREYDCVTSSSTVFHVTNSGDSSIGIEMVELAGVVSAVVGAREEDEEDEGVEAWDSANFSKNGFLSVSLEVAEEEFSSEAELRYFEKEDCTSESLRGVRFSRLADRASKHITQCSIVAMAVKREGRCRQ